MTEPTLSVSLKTLAAMRYIMQRLKQPPQCMGEVLYLADKAHLHRWGRLITQTQSQYVAIPDGVQLVAWPVLSELRMADCEELSVSGTMVLDEIIAHAKAQGPASINRRAKDGAWKRARQGARKEDRSPITREAMARTSQNAEVLLQHLADPHPGEAPAP